MPFTIPLTARSKLAFLHEPNVKATEYKGKPVGNLMTHITSCHENINKKYEADKKAHGATVAVATLDAEVQRIIDAHAVKFIKVDKAESRMAAAMFVAQTGSAISVVENDYFRWPNTMGIHAMSRRTIARYIGLGAEAQRRRFAKRLDEDGAVFFACVRVFSPSLTRRAARRSTAT